MVDNVCMERTWIGESSFKIEKGERGMKMLVLRGGGGVWGVLKFCVC